MIMTNFQFERLVMMLARCIELDNKSNELKDDGNIVLSINNFFERYGNRQCTSNRYKRVSVY